MEREKNYPLVSVVIPCYRTESFIIRCLDSIINQTYSHLEIICVNDGSGVEMSEILNEYAEKDERVIVVDNEQNGGLVKARCDGAKRATGKYISFVDSDDYVEKDFFRQLVFDAINQKSDLVLSNFCTDEDGAKSVFTGYSKESMLSTPGDSTFEKYLNNEGRIFRWHVIWGKLIQKKLWDKVSDYYYAVDQHLVMCEDVLFSTLIMRHAKNVHINDDAYYFYFSFENSATGDRSSEHKIIKNIQDIITVFSIVQNALNEISGENDGLDFRLKTWRDYYLEIWLKNAHESSKEAYQRVKKQLIAECPDYVRTNLKAPYFGIEHATPFEPKALEIKDEIIDHDTISFDIFDTLIARPFYTPSDLFKMMDKPAAKLLKSNHINKFSRLRMQAEARCRREAGERQEIKLDEIYSVICRDYAVSKTAANTLKKLEVELEYRFCTRRHYGYALYELSAFLGKRIIITSDMYLPKEVIEKILHNNGYDNYDKLYLSSKLMKTKNSGSLFKHLLDNEPSEHILHIDDNPYVCESAERCGIDAFMLPRAMLELERFSAGGLQRNFQDRHHSYWPVLEISGVRNSLAVAANKLHDNPFRSFDVNTNFNDSPYYLGYYALGMHLLALASWLLRDAENEDLKILNFLARDGFLPMKAVEIMQEKCSLNKKLKLNYILTSRRATLPLAIDGGYDFHAIQTYLIWEHVTPLKLLHDLEVVIDLPDDYKEILLKGGFNPKKKFADYDSYIDFLNYIRDNFYSKEKADAYREICVKYYGEFYKERNGTFDIGYSAKPELLVSSIVPSVDVTYFVHNNTSEAVENVDTFGGKLKTFYGYMPTFTGTLREAMMSSVSPTCKGYKEKDGKVVPVLSKRAGFDRDTRRVISELQQGAMDFVSDYCEIFGETFNDFDYHRFYMSVPLEYYLHYGTPADKSMFGQMYFDGMVGAKQDKLSHIWDTIILNNDRDFNHCRPPVITQVVMPESCVFLPVRRGKRMLYYILFNRKMLRVKFREKMEHLHESPKRVRRLMGRTYRKMKRLDR